MSMYKTEPLDSDLDDEMQDEHCYRCACGSCICDDRDPANVRVGKDWYAGDCPRLKEHPVVVGELAAQANSDEFRDDFNIARR